MDEADLEGSSNSFKTQGELIGHLQILRHITGLAKIEPVLDYVSEYIEEGNGESKITIFHHHKDVGEILFMKLSEMFPEKVIRMTAEDNSEVRMNKIEDFKNRAQILIAPTLACGEGINLQFCSHAIILEREWNPANEEQAEGRFSRIGSEASSILVNYPTATGTIDEFFAELVEQKRAAVTQTLDGIEVNWNESSVLKELAAIVVKKWRMK
jgi:SNF2 family DNA or RNA helicase